MMITKRKAKNLTDVRTAIFITKNAEKYKSFPGKGAIVSKIYRSENISWQERKRWLDAVVEWTGKRGTNYEWQCVLHNSVEIAQNLRLAAADRNPWKNHGGKMSVFSKKSNFYDPDISRRVNDKLNASGNRSNRIEFYLAKGLGLCQARDALKERQAVGRLDKFIQRYGEEEGQKRWTERQEKWLKNYKKTNFSKISQELFNSIAEKLVDVENIWYATFNRSEMESYKNKEYTLKLDKIVVKPDFIDVSKKLIIEFDGDYWHSETRANPKREKIKSDAMISYGYKLLRIKERDFNKDKEGCVKKCLDFLTQ